jgi:maleylacetate reductase
MGLVFEHETLEQRVLFGSDLAAEYVAEEIVRQHASRVMVIASKSALRMAQDITAGTKVALWHDEVVMHVPTDVADRARKAAVGAEIDLIVCVGGGSTTGLAKAIALTTEIPIVAIPTTYSGSEATNVWGLTEGARKTTGTSNRVLPSTIIYDASLTQSLPLDLSISSGLNGMAHCIDSLWGPRADPINAAMATEGIRGLAAGLSTLATNPNNIDGREKALYGAYLAAISFASAGSGMHHKICHVLGGMFNLPHAQTHAVILPYVLAFNAPYAPKAAARIATALGVTDALTGLQDLRAKLNAPRDLATYGFTRTNIEEAVQTALPLIPSSNPGPVNQDTLTLLLNAALAGKDPQILAQNFS